jgi:small conductance mechanosensitive channel
MAKVPAAMTRLLRLGLLLLILIVTPAVAQTAPADTPSRADLEKLVATLKNDQQRDALVTQLQGLIAAQKAAAAPPALDPATLLDLARDRLQDLVDELGNTATDLVDLPSVFTWFGAQWSDQTARARWIEIGRNVALIVGSALLADWILAASLMLPRRRLSQRIPAGRAAKIGLLAGEIILDILPAVGFWLTAVTVIPIVQPHFATRAVAEQLITVLLVGRVALVVAHTVLLVPARASWIAFPLSDETATYLYIWVRRFLAWGVFVRGIVAATWWLGVPGAVFSTLQKSVALVVTLLAIVFVLQNRQAVAAWIRPRPPATRDQPPLEDAGEMPVELPAVVPRHPALDLLRYRLAEIWHVLAVVYLAGIFCVYALKIEGGFAFLFRATVLTIALGTAARFLVQFSARAAHRGFAIPDEMRARFPTLELRANRYTPLLTGLTSAVIWAATLLAILEVWGVGSFGWLSSTLGRKAAGSVFTVIAILVSAFAIWEVMNAGIDRYLAGQTANGITIARSARVRTLMPLLRNALWLTILLIALLLILAALDVNIVPLLAGASVIGLAVGFGSQALVKDVITGFFILIEDTLAVGDVVDLGGQHSGTVEAISIRAVRLRDQTGAVHTLPFSDISTVKNLGRDYAYWVIDIGVPYSADPDHVLDIYRAVLADLKADPAFAPLIIGDLEAIGLNAFNPTTIQVQARIKTLPLKQWAVGREFSRRLKSAFDAAGIVLPQTVQTIGLDARTADLLRQMAEHQSASSNNPASASASAASSTEQAI